MILANVRRAFRSFPSGIVACAIAAAIAPCALGCGSTPEAASPDTFIAFSSDFVGFKSWQTFTLTSAPIDGSPHTSGPRTVYLNKKPPAGSTEFPVGTIIVKELTAPDDSRNTFAMVKRGGGYNQSGATNWEWFELKPGDDQAIALLWRGVGPPLGEKYGGDANGGCNLCHSSARG